MNSALDLGVHSLRAAYAASTLTCRAVIEEVLARIAAAGDDKVWITRVPDTVLLAQADEFDERRDRMAALPLYGIPFAIKDNIDYAGLPTTAACPGYAYTPSKSAEVVQRLVDAGAIVVGKTNLDQFATGLVGVRSPYGVPRNPFNADYIPGGSSSGSAVAVSSGLVSFSLGTDTAGSGRVPAGFNNIVGLKPTPGLLSSKGMLPACESLDCVSIFALSSSDAAEIFRMVAGPQMGGDFAAGFTFGVPRQPEFFGDADYAALYDRAIRKLQDMGGTAVEFDYTPFRDAAQLLYDGPWVAERTAAVGDFIDKADDKAGVWPVTRQIVQGGRKYSAVDAFRGQYRLKALQEAAHEQTRQCHFLALPTAPTIYKVADLEREPVLYNSHLGHYTNFVNFFHMCALALPAGFRPDGLPFGITLVAEGRLDNMLLEFGARWQRAMPLLLGKTASELPAVDADPRTEEPRIEIAVVGAHMSGLPLNGQLTGLRGRLVSVDETAPRYRLYALPGGPPQRPGMVRVVEGGASIAVEVWSLPSWAFGDFVSKIPAPLGIGTIELADGRTVQGFLCEAYAAKGAHDITSFGGWRAYMKSLAV